MGYGVIVAVHWQTLGIGNKGQLPWRIPSDMKMFKTLSVGETPGANVVIMGRKTWESLPPRFTPLPDRLNIVISRNLETVPASVVVVKDFDAALKRGEEHVAQSGGRIFLIGGASLIDGALEDVQCDTLYLTLVMSPHFDTDIGLNSQWRGILDRIKDGQQTVDLGWKVASDSGCLSENGTDFRMVALQRLNTQNTGPPQ